MTPTKDALVQRLREAADNLNALNDPDELLDYEEMDGAIDELEDEIRALEATLEDEEQDEADQTEA